MHYKPTRDEKRRLGLSTGCPPVGYVNLRRSGVSVPVFDLCLAPLVKAVFDWAGENDVPLPAVCRYAAGIGLTSRTGGPIGVSAMWSVLTNPFYTGRIRIGGELVGGRQPALVDRMAFDRVQRMLRKRRRESTPARTEPA